jgi:transcriptional regulator with XRE-family HTH domain
MNINSRVTLQSLKSIEKIVGGKLTLGKLLWAIRKSKEITQVNFAKQLNISKQHLCDIEHGRKVVSPKLAAEYAIKLGYSEKQFIRLALQDELDRAGLPFNVEVKRAA